MGDIIINEARLFRVEGRAGHLSPGRASLGLATDLMRLKASQLRAVPFPLSSIIVRELIPLLLTR